MEGFLNTVTERIRRAREERRIAETEKDSFPNRKAKSIIKTESSSHSISSNPQISLGKSCAQSSHSQTKRCKDHVHLHVCLNSRKCSDYINKF